MALCSWFTRLRMRARVAIVATVMLLIVFVQISITVPPLPLLQTNRLWPIPTPPGKLVHWHDSAYVQYVTDSRYLCNSLMIVEALHRLGAKADRLIMYPEDWDELEKPDSLLARARDMYKAKLQPVKLQSFEKEKDQGDETWRDSYTKLLAFNQTQYKRVLSLDSDVTVQKPIDELFLLPPTPLALPRAYWLPQPFLSSQLLLITPSVHEWSRIEILISQPDSGYDMDILNAMYNSSALILPHRPYNLITGEFRANSHEAYLGSKEEEWDAECVLREAKYVHFSDWPMPKPWVEPAEGDWTENRPKCEGSVRAEDCAERRFWEGLYRDFGGRRERICGRRYDD